MLKANNLKNLLLGKTWDPAQAGIFFQALFGGLVSPNTAVSTLTLLRERGETCQELAAAVQAVKRAEPNLHQTKDLPPLLDTCGTGGDGKGSFNISTISAFVTAGAGAFVAKHGNRSISSRVGSSDLMESLGVNILAPPARMIQALKRFRLGYFHAPLYHPAMKKVQEIRKRVRGRTLFNLIGPLLNPLPVKFQLIGVPNSRTAALVAHTVAALKAKSVYVVCGENGMDELTPYGTNRGYQVRDGRVSSFRLRASALSLREGKEADLRGGTLDFNRRLALGILAGRMGGTKRHAVLLNSAVALKACGIAASFEEGLSLAGESLDSGRAWTILKQLREFTRR